MINIVDDLFFINNIEELEDINFNVVKDEVKWQSMFSQGKPVPRLVAIQGKIIDGLTPLYRHPVDQQPILTEFSPEINRISHELSKILNQDFNHVLIQYYRSGDDFIGQHSDKTLDIKKSTNIVNYTLGARRTMKFKHKSDPSKNFKVSLKHNSVLILGPIANKNYLHYIDRDRRDIKTKSEDEKLNGGERISLTFRTIATFLTNDNRIVGQGAKKDTEIIDNSNEEKLRMLKAFSVENKTNNYEWEDLYQDGFNCLDLGGI